MRRHPRDPHDDPPRRPREREKPGPRPTLAQIRKEAPWVWAFCNAQGCHRAVPVAVVPFIIRWGPDASSDMIRNNLRCSECGHRGVKLQHPSAGPQIGWYPFPVRH